MGCKSTISESEKERILLLHEQQKNSPGYNLIKEDFDFNKYPCINPNWVKKLTRISSTLSGQKDMYEVQGEGNDIFKYNDNLTFRLKDIQFMENGDWFAGNYRRGKFSCNGNQILLDGKILTAAKQKWKLDNEKLQKKNEELTKIAKKETRDWLSVPQFVNEFKEQVNNALNHPKLQNKIIYSGWNVADYAVMSLDVRTLMAYLNGSVIDLKKGPQDTHYIYVDAKIQFGVWVKINGSEKTRTITVKPQVDFVISFTTEKIYDQSTKENVYVFKLKPYSFKAFSPQTDIKNTSFTLQIFNNDVLISLKGIRGVKVGTIPQTVLDNIKSAEIRIPEPKMKDVINGKIDQNWVTIK